MIALGIVVAAQIAAAAPRVPAIVLQAPLDPASSVAFHAMLAPDTVYLGEQATYQIAVFLDDRVRARMRRNPEFVPPELRSLVAHDLPGAGGRVYQRTAGDKRYEVHVFERALFGLVAGRVDVPPAQLLYSLPLSASFFSREESHALRSESAVLVIREPPLDGRPADYNGAVGILSLDAHYDSRTGKVGDPFVLTVGVSGEANVGHLPRPNIELPWGTVVPASERVRLDSVAVRVRGRKEFDWILTPRDTGVLRLPSVRYWFFNPIAERYELAIAEPESIVVAPATLALADTAGNSQPMLGVRRVYRGETPPPIPDRPWFWLLALIAPIPAAVRATTSAWSQRRRRPERAARVLNRLARRGSSDAGRVRRAYVAALAERLLLPAETLTRRGELARLLRLSGVRKETARAADDLLSDLDESIYAEGQHPSPKDAGRRADEIVRNVDREAIRRVITMVMAAAVIGAASPALANPAREAALRATFQQGVTAYAQREFGTSARRFADVAHEAPRAGDAWANFGTAGWAAGDTAAAAVGWQRALRLEPRAEDVRERIALIGTTERGFVSFVPPVTSSEVAVLALLIWFTIWGMLAMRDSGDSMRNRMSLLAACLLVIVATSAGGLRELERGARLAVISEGGPLRLLPALGADQGASALVGEVARTKARQGVWTRVELDGGRSGWVETQRLVPLDS